MSIYLFLNWALLTVSIFNTVVMLWLGLTVLLNAERYTGGVWLMGFGMLGGAAFFVSHTAIIGQELHLNPDGLNFWWRVGWIPVIVIPALWYILILWYAGFWSQPRPNLFWRHRFWLVSVLAVVVIFGLLFVLANVIPDYDEIVQLNLDGALRVGGVPLAFLALPAIMVGCILLSIDALRHPAPSERLMGEDARLRSRPWLMRAAVVLLVISLLVTGFIAQIVSNVGNALMRLVNFEVIALFDLFLESLIALVAFFIGQAIVSYEVFTGTALPRRGFFRQWLTMLGFAGIYAIFVAWGIAIGMRTIYLLLATTALMVTFYTLYNWRAFAERDHLIKQLRPFVSSQRLMTGLIGTDLADFGGEELFRILCRNILNTDRAFLTPIGSLIPILPALSLDSSQQDVHFEWSAGAKVERLTPTLSNGFHWAIPLQSERGQVGMLYIGSKRDGGLFTREEIELAQAGGERVIDTLAGEYLARRLMELQRGRLAENRVTDRRTRRALHDEVLPVLHMTILQLSGSKENDAAIYSLTEVHQQISRLIHQSQNTSVQVGGEVDLVAALRRIVEEDLEQGFDQVTWQMPESLILSPLVSEVVVGAAWEVLRNAARHARDEGSARLLHLWVKVVKDESGIILTVQDDGVGVHAKPRRSGGGNGLILHGTLLTVIGGSLSVESPPEGGTRAVIRLA